MRKDGEIRPEVSIRVGNASAAFRNMGKVWNEGDLPLCTTLKIFNSFSRFVLMSRCESWQCFREAEERVKRFESDCLREIIKIR